MASVAAGWARRRIRRRYRHLVAWSMRGVEIVSEASRHLTDELKSRHPIMPWTKVAGIGNVLRHSYENISAPIMGKLVREDLPSLEKIRREELMRELARES